jgi:hypothetical protein
VAHLLPTWDEYTVAYRDRSAALPPGGSLDPALFPYGALSNVVTIDGCVRGAWSRSVTRSSVRVSIRLLAAADEVEMAALNGAAGRLGRFLELPADLTCTDAAD